MQIIILGAGAIGSLIGAKLAAHNDVTLVARAEHVRAVNTSGLRVQGLESRAISVRAVESIETIAADALILVTTKVHATAAALAPVRRLIRPETTVLCLQNGLGAEAVARDALHNQSVVLRGITQLGAIFEQPGLIKFMAEGHTLIEQHERSEQIAALFNLSGLNTRISRNIAADIWHKLILNCVVNPITSMIGREVGAIADPQLDQLKELVIGECLAVAAAEGISLDTDFQCEIRQLYAASRNIVSMRQDLNRGRCTEIDYMNGAVAALGAKHGIDCPVNAALTQIIKAMEGRHCSHRKCSSRS